MRWFEALSQLTQAKTPLVMITIVSVRGHAPREAGAKMLVTGDGVYGTIGGGNLEATAVALARNILAEIGKTYPGNVGAGLRPAPTGTVSIFGDTQDMHEARPTVSTYPSLHTIRLTENADSEYGIQCCGGEVTLLLEPVISAKPTVAIFGVGHVGLALAQVLSIFPVELWLVDSRESMLTNERLAPLQSGQAAIKVHHAPILDGIVNDLPAGSHLLIMTHDHAEDLYITEMALSRKDLGFTGLIGSATKWARFRQKLQAQGFDDTDLSRVTTPIGLPTVPGKSPEAIAVAVAAQLVPYLTQSTMVSKSFREGIV